MNASSQCDGTLGCLHHALYEQAREMVGKEASPTTAIVDSQSVKGAERGGRPIDPVGYDAAKKVKGRKRHAVVDTLGLMLGCAILPGNVLPPIIFPGRPERWWGDEALKAETDAPQATLEQRHQAAGDVLALRCRGFFSAGALFSRASHIPVETAQ